VSKNESVECDDPAEVRQRLELLRIEHQLAVRIGLDADPEYMADLERQLEIWEAAWIGAAVTQVAVTRAQTQGRLEG
jgi:hypothetical protein